MKTLPKAALVFVLIIIIALTLSIADIFYFPISHNRLDVVQRYIADQIDRDWDNYLNSIPPDQKKLVDYNKLLDQLNFVERKLVKRVFAIDPKDLGFKGPFFSKEPMSAEKLVLIPSKQFITGSEKYGTGVNFIPNYAYTDYEKMMQAMQNDLQKRLYVDSSYRSPGYQAKVFFERLAKNHDYSLTGVAREVAPPGYSEHNNKNIAIDFINQDGINGLRKGQTAEDFEKLPEFTWMAKNADEFNFYLSYPRDNGFGMEYEPWHWHWEQK